jgi:hypothetical protein
MTRHAVWLSPALAPTLSPVQAFSVNPRAGSVFEKCRSAALSSPASRSAFELPPLFNSVEAAKGFSVGSSAGLRPVPESDRLSAAIRHELSRPEKLVRHILRVINIRVGFLPLPENRRHSSPYYQGPPPQNQRLPPPVFSGLFPKNHGGANPPNSSVKNRFDNGLPW